MNEHILGPPKDIGKAKALALVEPLHPRGFKRQIGDILGQHMIGIFAKRKDGPHRRLDAHDLDGLHPALRLLNTHRDARPVRDRTLPEIPQHIRMQQDISACIVGDDKAKTLGRIEPFYATMHNLHGLFFVCHVKSRFPR